MAAEIADVVREFHVCHQLQTLLVGIALRQCRVTAEPREGLQQQAAQDLCELLSVVLMMRAPASRKRLWKQHCCLEKKQADAYGQGL
jgi:hypothetical protein